MTDQANRRQTVEIMGESIPVKTSEQGDGTHRAVALVEDKIETIQTRSPDANRLQVALLSCLNLAGQLVKMEDSTEFTGISEGTLERLEQLEDRVDQQLDEDQ